MINTIPNGLKKISKDLVKLSPSRFHLTLITLPVVMDLPASKSQLQLLLVLLKTN
jgi:hypothetical protein